MSSQASTRTSALARFALTALLLLLVPAASAEVIDDFETAQAVLTDSGTSVVTDNGADVILGDHRELEIELVEGTAGATAEATGGALVFDATAGADTRAVATMVWDADTNTTVFDGDGLAGVDLTDNNETAFRIEVATADADTQILLEVFTNNGNSSKAGLRLPAVVATTDFFISYADFIPNLGTGADFSSVGAIVLRVLGTNVGASISFFETVGPTLTVTKIDIDPNDDMDFGTDPVVPGDTIRYRVDITNDGGLAQQVDLADTVDGNTTFTMDSLTATPVALVDTVAVLGNVTRTVADPGVLANDQDPDNDALFVRVSNSDTMSAQGATIAWNDAGSDGEGEGGFQYFPPAGFRGIDSFAYELEDADGDIAAGLVTVILDRVIWFVDNTNGGPFEGTQANPFDTLAAAQAASAAGDIIRLREGDGTSTGYDNGFTFKDGQQLIGGGVALVIDGQIVEAATGRPIVTSPGTALTLAQNVTLRGFDIGNTGGSGIFGPVGGSGLVTISDLSIFGSGRAINMFGPTTLDATIDSIASSGGVNGVIAENCGGSLVVNGTTTISGTSGAAVFLQNVPAGAVWDLGDVTITTASSGVVLNSSPMASFTFDGLDVTSAGTALSATSAGSVTIGGVLNTLETTAGGAAILASMTEMTGGWTFDNVTSDGSPTHGIALSGMTGGNFLVTGATDINDPTNNGIDVEIGGARTYDFGATDISGTGVPAGAVGHGIDIISSNSMSTFTFDSLAIATDNGAGLLADGSGTVNIAGTGNSIASTTGPAIDIAMTTVDDAPGGPVTGITFATLSSTNSPTTGVNLVGVNGSVTGTAGSIMGAAGTAFNVGTAANNSGGSSNVTYGGSITNTAARSVAVQERNGGGVTLSGTINDTGTGILVTNNNNGVANSVTFSGSSKVVNTGTNIAIDLVDNDDAIVSFTGGGLDVDTTTAVGFNAAQGAAGINVTGTGNTIMSAATAVSVVGSTIGASGISFESVDVDLSGVAPDAPAIVLTSTGSGTFSVTGVGSIGGSGGTIENILNSDGVRLSDVGGLITLRNMIIEDIGHTSDAADGIGTRREVDGIHGEMVTGGLRLDNTTMRRFSDNAILGASFADSTQPTTWVGLEILNSTLQDSNRYHVGPEDPTGLGDDSGEGMVRILGISGTVLIDNNTFERGAQLIDFLTASSGLLAMTAQRNNFNHTIKEFRCSPPGTVNIGKAGISVRVDGSADADLFIGDPAEANPGLGNAFVDNATASIVVLHDTAAATGEIDTIISRNTFRVVDHLTGPAGCPGGTFQFNTPTGGVFLGPGSGDFEGIVSNNLFDQLQQANGGIGQLSVTFDDGGDAELIVRGNTFDLPWDASVRLLADANNSAAVLFGGPGAGQANTYVDGTVGSPGDDVGGPTQSPFNPWSVNVRNGGRLDLKIDSEILPQHDDMFSAFAHSFDASVNATGGTLNLHITDSASPDGYRFDIMGGTVNLFNEENVAPCPIGPDLILDHNNNTGGMNADGTDPPVVVGGGVTCTTTPPTAPSLVIP